MGLWEKIVLGLKYGLFLVALSFSIHILYYLATTFLGLTLSGSSPTSDLEFLKNSMSNIYVFLFLVLSVTVLGPLAEECVFRWLPIRLIRSLTNNQIALWAVIITASVIFGLLHGNTLMVFLAGVSGIFLSLAFLEGGLISSWVAHSFFNTVGTIVLLIQLYFFK